jgi:hypothetical protein
MVVHGLGLLAERALNVTPPGIVIDQSSDWENIYLGSPSIAVLPDGTYVASHDYFGPGTSYDTCAVFRSTDRGATWTRASILTGQFWSLLFVCQDKLHIIGSTARWSSLVVRRSDDGGFTWTDPVDADNGLIVVQDNDFLYGIAPGAMLVHDGRLWKSAVRRDNGPRVWDQPRDFFVLSAPVNSNLLHAASWRLSAPMHHVPQLPDPWLVGEGNVVLGPDANLYNFLRVDYRPRGGLAGLVRIPGNGGALAFDPETGFVEFPGGCKKFTVRYDAQSGLYWSLSN